MEVIRGVTPTRQTERRGEVGGSCGCDRDVGGSGVVMYIQSMAHAGHSTQGLGIQVRADVIHHLY